MAGPAYYTAIVNIAKNEDWIVPFVYGAAPAVEGDPLVPIDLSSSKLKMEMRVREEDHEALVSVFSPDGGIVITNALAGEFTITIRRSLLARIPPGDYVIDLVRLVADIVQERIWEGAATVVEGTTR